jgi:hypothetical protein
VTLKVAYHHGQIPAASKPLVCGLVGGLTPVVLPGTFMNETESRWAGEQRTITEPQRKRLATTQSDLWTTRCIVMGHGGRCNQGRARFTEGQTQRECGHTKATGPMRSAGLPSEELTTDAVEQAVRAPGQ